MSTEARNVFRAVALAVLDGSLPIESGEQTKALEALLGRIDDLMSALPQHTQVELSQLLGLLATSAGRLALVGLNDHWSLAPVPDVQTALQSMRTSRLAVKRQTYAALRDIAASAYVSVPEVWPQLGYPGPIAIS